jgi:hypothetical protein
MALPVKFSLLRSELNPFLYAGIGEDENGMEVTMLSGLARLGYNPWEEAARLVSLPKAIAAQSVALLISRLAMRRDYTGALTTSMDFVKLLPSSAAAPPPAQPLSRFDPKGFSRWALLLTSLLFLGVIYLT